MGTSIAWFSRMATTTYHGSCHCKGLTYEADIDLAKGTGKCNCSYCWKVRNWSIGIKPADFRWRSRETLGQYGFAPDSTNHHLFCTRCGVRVGTQGHVAEIGGDYVSVALATLDDLEPAKLVEAPVKLMNGRDNDWFHEPKETRQL